MNNQKTKQSQNPGLPHKTRRPLILVLVGTVLIGVGALLLYAHLQGRSPVNTASEPASYTIDQNVTAQPRYSSNSFFTKIPDAANTAFITNITDTIDAQFNYTFRASEVADLSYRYQTTASIRALFGSDSSAEGGRATVWSKQFILQETVSGNRRDSSVTLNPVIRIPFAEYKKQMEQFRNTFSTPTSGEVVVTHTVQMTGNVRGLPIKETKTATITAPLDQQVYKLSNQFEKTAQKELTPVSAKGSHGLINKLELPAAIALILAGLACAVYGLTKQKIKSPHQRELEKIYRYHDGIIIRATHPPELENKNIVTIKNFDDMLNLEEELKTPIIASKISDYTTHFFVTRDDIVYVHTLGIPVPFKSTPVTDVDGNK